MRTGRGHISHDFGSVIAQKGARGMALVGAAEGRMFDAALKAIQIVEHPKKGTCESDPIERLLLLGA